jgi:hypothetical protein
MFTGMNKDLPPSAVIHVIEIDERLRVMLEVGEDARGEDLRALIPLALRWRDRLMDFQGPWMGGGRNLFLETILTEHRLGMSYARIADRINARVADLLLAHREYLRELESVKRRFTRPDDWITWRPKTNPFSIDHARGVLRWIGLSERLAESAIAAGLERIRNQRRIRGQFRPVTRDRVRTVLRTWRTSVKHRTYMRTPAGPRIERLVQERAIRRQNAH